MYVDVFKAAREWCHMLLTDYNCRSDLSPPLEISPAIAATLRASRQTTAPAR